jgi:CHAD domain-containing protein
MKPDSKDAPPLAVWAEGVVKARVAVLRRELERLQKKPNEDAIHDVRVATRRLRAALRHLRPCFAKAGVRRMISAVRSLAALLGEARDIDIILQNLVSAGESPAKSGDRRAGATRPFARWKSGLERQRSDRLKRAVPIAGELVRRLPALERGVLS